MKFETGQQLVDRLRSLCDNVKKRLWIGSPYIGSWGAIRRILGKKWLDNFEVEVRLITDISDASNLSYETMKNFWDKGKIKSMRGLHAKIYIVDDCAILTSANLTQTAFTKRHEVAIFLSADEAKWLINLYEEWWENTTEEVSQESMHKISRSRTNIEKEETSVEGLPERWRLPPDPGKLIPIGPRFGDYESFLRSYRDFAEGYLKVQRIWPNAPLYFETDSFLNYLFHEAPGIPSKEYTKKKPRSLSENERIKEMKRHASQFSKWVSKGGNTRWREESSRIIRTLLDRDNIMKLEYADIKKIVEQLNCMNSMPLAKSRFLNPDNNDLNQIRGAWENLLYGKDPLQARMTHCKNSLYSFGRSSIQELLGFFKPDEYPLRNRNSSAGLRFFGYNVSVY